MSRRARRANIGARCSTTSSATIAADLRNKLLNYGYAVVRAAVARALVAYGCLPALGLHHASATNAFNLADDYLEPFRPFVDALAAERAEGARDSRRYDGRGSARHGGRSAARTPRLARRDVHPSRRDARRPPRASFSAMEGASAALLRLPEIRRRRRELAAMKSEEVRFMWMFVFFDLPVGTKTERRHATRFRNFLKDDGFMMLQFSVYARVMRGEEAVDKHLARVTKSFRRRAACAH